MEAGARAHQPSSSSSSSGLSSPSTSRPSWAPGPVEAAAAGASAATLGVGAAAPPGARTPLAAIATAGATARASHCRTSLPAMAAGRAHAEPSLRQCSQQAVECSLYSRHCLRCHMPLLVRGQPGASPSSSSSRNRLCRSHHPSPYILAVWPSATSGPHTPTFTWLPGSAPPCPAEGCDASGPPPRSQFGPAVPPPGDAPTEHTLPPGALQHAPVIPHASGCCACKAQHRCQAACLSTSQYLLHLDTPYSACCPAHPPSCLPHRPSAPAFF